MKRAVGWAAAIPFAAYLAYIGANYAAPGLLARAGFGTGYDVSLLRWGHAESHAYGPPEVWRWGNPRTRRSLAFAFAGERIVIDYDVDSVRGWATISVEQGLFGSDAIHERTLRSPDRGTIRVPVPAAGFYTAEVFYVFRFRGRSSVDWRVE